MTFVYIVKKVTVHWIEQLSKLEMAKSMVVQESLSITSANAAFNTGNNKPKND